MRILIVGASGTIGQAVADRLASGHELVRAARTQGDLRVDISEPGSIRAMYDRLGPVDAVVGCAGSARYGAFETLSDEDFAYSLANKLMGQINLVRLGLASVRDRGSFTITAGVFSQKPAPGVATLAMVNGALESFGRAAALDLSRGIRLNVVSPPWIKETAARAGKHAPLSAADNALAYIHLINGTETGTVVYP